MEKLVGVPAVCLTAIRREGRRLLAPRGGNHELRAGPAHYNRVIFYELVSKDIEAPFDYRSELDVTWVPHPNWYWIWSKATIPFLNHPAVPRAWLLSTLDGWPEDLERYVLKPLYSFAGRGVIIDVDRAALDWIPEAARHEWMLMEKLDDAPAFSPRVGRG